MRRLSFGDKPSKSAQETFALVVVFCLLGVGGLLTSVGMPDWAAVVLALGIVGAISLAIGLLTKWLLALAGGLALMLLDVIWIFVHFGPWLSHGWVPTILVSSVVVLASAAIGGYAWRVRRRQPPGARATRETGGCMVPLIAALIVLCGPCLVALGTPQGVDTTWFDGYTEAIAAVVVVVFISFVQIRDRTREGRLRRLVVGLPAVLLIAGSVGLFLAAILGLGMRSWDPADYHGWYGTRVQVQLPDTCGYLVQTRRSGAKGADPNIVCEHALWQLAGRAVTGTAVIGWDDVEQPEKAAAVPERVDAFALGDTAYSVKRVGHVRLTGIYAGLPWWLLLLAPLSCLTGFFVLSSWGRWFKRFEVDEVDEVDDPPPPPPADSSPGR